MVTRGERVYIQSGTCERQLCDVVVVVVTTIASGVSRCRDSDGSMGLSGVEKGALTKVVLGFMNVFRRRIARKLRGSCVKLREVARKK